MPPSVECESNQQGHRTKCVTRGDQIHCLAHFVLQLLVESLSSVLAKADFPSDQNDGGLVGVTTLRGDVGPGVCSHLLRLHFAPTTCRFQLCAGDELLVLQVRLSD